MDKDLMVIIDRDEKITQIKITELQLCVILWMQNVLTQKKMGMSENILTLRSQNSNDLYNLLA